MSRLEFRHRVTSRLSAAVPRSLPPGPAVAPVKLTVVALDLRLPGMSADSPKQQFELELRKLESRIGELINTCSQLKEENRSLRHRQEALIGERATLLQKNEQVRARVEGMITRLKAMETGT